MTAYFYTTNRTNHTTSSHLIKKIQVVIPKFYKIVGSITLDPFCQEVRDIKKIGDGVPLISSYFCQQNLSLTQTLDQSQKMTSDPW